jgi:hypothetical protein
MNLNPYTVFDHVLVDCLEAGDIIRWDGEAFEVIKLISMTDGFIIKAVDELEDEVELSIPDNTILPLLEEE